MATNCKIWKTSKEPHIFILWTSEQRRQTVKLIFLNLWNAEEWSSHLGASVWLAVEWRFKKKKTTKTFMIRVSLGKRQVILFPHNQLVGELWDDSVFLSGELLTLCFLCRLLINQWVSKSIGYLPLQVMNTACLCELIFQRGKKIELTLLCLASTHVYNFILLKLCMSFICG